MFSVRLFVSCNICECMYQVALTSHWSTVVFKVPSFLQSLADPCPAHGSGHRCLGTSQVFHAATSALSVVALVAVASPNFNNETNNHTAALNMMVNFVMMVNAD